MEKLEYVELLEELAVSVLQHLFKLDLVRGMR
jgi:hypothetical protein